MLYSADQVGRYKIGDVLGEGSFSTVASCTSIQFSIRDTMRAERTRNTKSLSDLSDNIITNALTNNDNILINNGSKIKDIIEHPSRRAGCSANKEFAVKIIDKKKIKSLSAVYRLSKVMQDNMMISLFLLLT